VLIFTSDDALRVGRLRISEIQMMSGSVDDDGCNRVSNVHKDTTGMPRVQKPITKEDIGVTSEIFLDIPSSKFIEGPIVSALDSINILAELFVKLEIPCSI